MDFTAVSVAFGPITTFQGLYTTIEIKERLNYIEHSSNKNRKFTDNDFKNGKIPNAEWSSLIFERIKDKLPTVYQDTKGKTWKFVSAAPYIYYSKILHGQRFNIHTDTGSVFDEANNKFSKFTLLTYLNDDFEGGETVFYNDFFQETLKIKPITGLTVMFDIDLFHQGNPVLSGQKYWLGTEIVCEKIDLKIVAYNSV